MFSLQHLLQWVEILYKRSFLFLIMKSTRSCSIPWRSGEQNQQNQWGTTLQIFSLPINRNSHPARQCFVCHGYNWFNGKTWGIELPITYSTLSILTQWRASRSLKIYNLIILFNTVNIPSSSKLKKELIDKSVVAHTQWTL